MVLEVYSLIVNLIILVLLEMLLSIDNLILISIIISKLPYNKRDKASNIGILLAMLARFLLLYIVYWTSKFNKILNILSFNFSIKNLTFLFGGFFLLIKTSIEIYNFINKNHKKKDNIKERNDKYFFYYVISQVVFLDSLFSIDSIITSIGIIDNIWIIFLSILIVMIIIFFLSKKIVIFLNDNPNVVLLFLSFLLLMGINLVLSGFSIYIPKSYLYSIIFFASLVEFFNYILRYKIKNKKYIEDNKKIENDIEDSKKIEDNIKEYDIKEIKSIEDDIEKYDIEENKIIKDNIEEHDMEYKKIIEDNIENKKKIEYNIEENKKTEKVIEEKKCEEVEKNIEKKYKKIKDDIKKRRKKKKRRFRKKKKREKKEENKNIEEVIERKKDKKIII
ncbi:TerC family protein [Candidatus Annandia pinicola]|uniref:TerC family protein n=1 Tax=Candidatus Annandia pinicola TaxID=1345117 RepID=UPI001D010737|nr:hypothetical protein [Candidatus Annandia pinicola]